jgi:DNA-binding XRE family transcriptional regulator
VTANQFKRIRLKYWKSQAQAADALGITRGAVGHYENGRRPVPESIVKLIQCIERNHVAQKST